MPLIVVGVLALSASFGLGATLLLERRRARALRELGNAARGLAQGDLDQEITLLREDELGQIAESFRGIIAYEQQLARILEAVARGDLAQVVEPRSEHDVLGSALARTIANLRDLVRSIEEEQENRRHEPFVAAPAPQPENQVSSC